MAKTAAIDASGITFSGLAAGDGQPALLLHGFPDTPFSLSSQVDHLGGRGFRAFAPALRGYPPTGGDGPFGIDRLASDALELLEQMGANPDSPGVLIGHDWGGIIACAAAATRPEIMSHVVIMSVPHPMVMGARFLSGDFDQLKRSWYMFFFQMPGLAESVVSADNFAFLERLMLDWSPNLIQNEGRAEIERRKLVLSAPGALSSALGYYRAMFGESQVAVGPVRVQALVIFGAEDGCIAPTICDGMEALFPAGYSFEVIEGAGHFVPSESPDAVNSLISGFLANQ
ncbi:MAG: alpha/beta hydrolase [Acidobacteria bacterium]|nr:MAG: alpha/beta hydrolase [Acidobacteriota bacterium]